MQDGMNVLHGERHNNLKSGGKKQRGGEKKRRLGSTGLRLLKKSQG